MKKRWTPEEIEKVIRLRYEKLWTLKMIGDQYGVSRQRICQVLGDKAGGKCVTSKKKRMLLDINNISDLPIEELCKRYDLSEQVVTNVLGQKIALEPVISYLEGWGLRAEKDRSRSGTFLLVNDRSVHVSFAYKETTPKRNVVSSSYAFRVENTKNYDYALLCIKNTMEMFVIPASELVGKSQIRFVWDDRIKAVFSYFRIYHYQKYFNRFDLLR